jgi:hypothetical protein
MRFVAATAAFMASNFPAPGASSISNIPLPNKDAAFHSILNEDSTSNTKVGTILQIAHQQQGRRIKQRRQRKLQAGLTNKATRDFNNKNMKNPHTNYGNNELMECTLPSSQAPDVGILSCSVGQYCVANAESTMGGVCVRSSNDLDTAVDSVITESGRQRHSRTMQDSTTSFLEMAEEVCSMEDLTCNTCAVNADAYTAEFDCEYDLNCYTLGSLCKTTQIEFCENHTLAGTLSGQNDFQSKVCYTLTKPEDFSYCVTYTYFPDPEVDATCEIEIDGVICNSCTLLFQGAVSGDWCREFDCENTRLGKSANNCDYSILEAFTTGYLYDQLPCEGGCNLCGEGGSMMYSSTMEFTIPRVSTMNCFQTQLMALTGTFNSEQCLELETLVQEPCNCTAKSPETAPNSNSAGMRSYPIATAAVAAATMSLTVSLA